jgi:hypothetical protein
MKLNKKIIISIVAILSITTTFAYTQNELEYAKYLAEK